MDLINRLSILDPEDFSEGPETTDIDEEDLVKWLSTPGRAPEFSSIARSSSISINRRSDLNINESRDLIDVSWLLILLLTCNIIFVKYHAFRFNVFKLFDVNHFNASGSPRFIRFVDFRFIQISITLLSADV